jgi:hypothetical protein
MREILFPFSFYALLMDLNEKNTPLSIVPEDLVLAFAWSVFAEYLPSICS